MNKNNKFNKPLVSICIPNYNYGHFVEIAINSALKQTYENLEIIVVDNYSTDNSHQIITKIRQNFNFIYERNNSNIGMVQNFNKCKDLSSGEYLVFLSSDDVLQPEFISRCVDIFTEKRVGMVATHCHQIDSHGLIIEKPPFYVKSAIIQGAEHARIFLMSGVFFPSQVLIKRSLINQIGGWNLKYPVFFDWYMWFQLALLGDIGYISDALVLYRWHDNNDSGNAIKNMQMVFEKYLLKLDFFNAIDDKPELMKHRDEAIKKISNNCIFYSSNLLREKNLDLAKKYLNMALVFDPSMEKNEFFKVLKFCTTLEPTEANLMFEKISFQYDDFGSKRPFDLPPNSIVLGK